MKHSIKSIFNLIEIFRKSPKRVTNIMLSNTHCEHEQLHDYYCDAEKPHINP
ncbi:hypothetical protein [Winogradskyella poriferorum]|uniref:hypothetical protein n=1 Tax=Winogradskyella poriferorum TaxID=307627 RepID=UPI0026867AD9